MKLFSLSTSLAVAFATAALFCANPAAAQLSAPGFEAPFTTSDLVGFPSQLVDRWAAEQAEVVAGLNDGVTPIRGNQMLKLLNDSSTGDFNEVSQVVGVEHFASTVDAGMLEANYFVCFNVPEAAAGAVADIFLKFYDGSGAELGQSSIVSTPPLDGDVTTWEHAEIGMLLFDGGPAAAVPSGTRSVGAFFQFDNASLNGMAGYADKIHLGFAAVPEPSSVVICFTALAALFGFRRR